MAFKETIRNLRRTREIIKVLLKYGFEDLVSGTILRKFVSEKRRANWMRADKPVMESSRYERIRMACEELGPTFVKSAQVLSNRPDLLPEELIFEFQKLQSQVRPFPYEEVKQIIEEELGQSINDVFREFNEKPIGSASIGQVHKAVLHDGREVVIKVRRPNVDTIIKTDISIMKEVVRRGNNYFEKQGIINAMDVVEALEKTMSKELDYTNEARNIEQFRHFYRKYDYFYAPKVFRELSTRKIMIMEYVDACKITDTSQLIAWGLNPEKIAEKGMQLYMMQIFEYGFFHADPHPGNVLIRQDGTICLIDFGMMGKLTKRDKSAFAGIFISMAREDARSMAMYFRQLTIEDNIQDMRTLENDLSELIDDFAHLDVAESNMAELAERLQKVIYENRMRVPGAIFLILRALAILEGIGKTIAPHFNTQKFIEPYGADLLKEQFSLENITEELLFNGNKMIQFVTALPTELGGILKQMRKGKFVTETVHRGYEPLLRKLDRITNRLILGTLVSVLILGSAITTLAPVHDSARDRMGLPIISTTGFVVALVLSIILMYNILRNKKY